MKFLALFFALLLPIYSIDDLEFPHLVSSFSISLENHDGNVRQNLALAIQKLNRYKIEPKSTFSFNKIAEEGSVENGFKFKLYSTSDLEYEYESRLETVEETRLQEESGKYKNGLLVYLYRDKYKNKELVESEFIHSDYIRPMYVQKSKPNSN
jgi:hypothetical protein